MRAVTRAYRCVRGLAMGARAADRAQAPRSAMHWLSSLVVVTALSATAGPPAVVNAAEAPSDPGRMQEVQSVFVHVPPALPPDARVRVLLVLHGMGGKGDAFSREFLSMADANGWLVVAPTISYGDWTDPVQVASEEPALIAWLNDYLDRLPTETGLTIAPRILALGHSRGAQLAVHFAEFHPERVRAVAALSAGTYTLPSVVDADNRPVTFPFGVADLAARDGGRPFDQRLFATVPLWIGVGADDVNPADLPRAWDPYIGTTRVERARAFADTLQKLGAPVTLTLFPGAGHGLTTEMRQVACARLALTASVETPAQSAAQ